MSNFILNELLELFPDVSEDFLSGILDAYKDEEVTIEELVDVIVSFEFKPPREIPAKSCETNLREIPAESCETNSRGIPAESCETNSREIPAESCENNSPGAVIVKSEILEPASSDINSSIVHKPVENEVLQNSASLVNVNGNLPYNNNESMLDSSSSNKQSIDSDKPVANKVVSENNGTNDSSKISSAIKSEPQSNDELEVTINSPMIEQCNNEITKPTSDMSNNKLSNNQDCSTEDEDDSSPEYSIRYLMEEGIVLERHSITTDQLRENPEEDIKFATNLNETKFPIDISLNASHPSNNQMSLTSKSSFVRLKKTNVPRKRSVCTNVSTLRHSSTKRATLRSCKVKNEEDRLRRRLINQSRLLHGREVKSSNSVDCSSQFLDTDRKYSLLCNIFTDANPTYLLDQCEFLTDQEKILDFISRNLELRDYPKIEVLPELMEEFHCTVADFLEIIPDPVAGFSNANYVRDGYEENAEIYLKARYDGVNDADAKERLRACSYNLLSACTQLENEGKIPVPQVLDYTPLHHPASFYFNQEVWYIEHRKEVQEFLDSAIEAARMQEELNRPPTPVPEVFECKICAEEIVDYTDIRTCDAPKGHLFCANCTKRSVEIRIGDGETTFPCLVNCGSFIPLRTVEELLSANDFDRLMGRIQEEEIRKANIAGVETCPFCPFAYGPGEETLFTCLNPKCRKLSCRICRKEDHLPEMCEMFKNEDEERARLIIEDRMAEALMRTCYSCGKKFVKSDGCNKMVCTCGAKMCYVCRQPVQDYSHFNGQGGDNLDRCPLWSEFDELHDRPVEATAQQVFNQIAANNPQLNLDAAKLIPK